MSNVKRKCYNDFYNHLFIKVCDISYLIGAGDPQSVEEGDKDLSSDGRHDGVREAEEPEGRSEAVSLSRCADDRDAGHEAGGE